MTFPFPTVPLKSALSVSHLGSAGINGNTSVGVTTTHTLNVSSPKTLVALSTAQYGGGSLALTFEVGASTISPLISYSDSGYQQSGRVDLYVIDTPTGSTVDVDITCPVALRRYTRLDSFSVNGTPAIQNSWTGTYGDANTGVTLSTEVLGNGHLLAVGTSIENKGPAGDRFVGTCGLDHYPEGVSSQSIKLRQSENTESSAVLSGITNVGTKYSQYGSFNYSDGVQLLVVALELS